MKHNAIGPMRRLMGIGSMVLFLVSLFTAPPISAASDEMTESLSTIRLVERVDLYYTLLQERDSLGTFGMLAEEWRSGSQDERDWVKDGKKAGRSLRILEWRITDIETSGERARLKLEIDTKVHEGFWKWSEKQEGRTAFWVFEQGDWYHIPSYVKDWDSEGALQVPIPVSPSE